MTTAPNPLIAGSIRRSVFLLAIPAMGSMLAQTCFGLVDGFWVGRLGPVPLAALGGSSFFLWGLLAIGEMVGVGTTALVAQSVGAGRRDDAGRASLVGLAMSFLVGGACVAPALAIQGPLLDLIGMPPDVKRAAIGYGSVLIAGLPVMLPFYACDAIYRGHGNTRTPMLVDFAAVVVNALADPLLIFGWGPFPQMGVQGAALATVAAHAAGLVIKIALFRRAGIILASGGSGRMGIAATIARVGAPACLAGVSISVVFVALARQVIRFGTPALAALSLCHRLESIPYFACVGFAAAAAALAGQNVGAGRPDRAARVAWHAVGYCALLIGFVSLAYLFVPAELMRAFTRDEETIAIGARYLRIIALIEAGMAVELVLAGALSGAGDTVVPTSISTTFAVARLPLAALFSGPLGLGLDGIWYAVAITVVVKAALMAAWFQGGRWRRRRLVPAAGAG